MYPILVTIGSFEVTTFGVMMAAAVIAGMWLFARELRSSRLPERAINGAMLAVAAGLVGAKLLFVAEHAAIGSSSAVIFASPEAPDS
jgi:prolipoprotein diacylglyceryltransferase